MSAPALTAVVLAGTRPGGDPLAALTGMSHKALIEVGGKSMLARVVEALAGAPEIARIVVAIDRPDVLEGLPPVSRPVQAMPAAHGPSASVAAALAQLGAPLLVTTADHALLRAQWVSEFIAAARQGPAAQADVVIALARRADVLAAVPETQRTWLRLADDAYSGCNLFLLRTPAAAGLVHLWQQLEADRKRPLSLLRRLGFTAVLRYRLGRLTLADVLERLGRLGGAHVAPVILRDGRAAIDVDKPADLALVQRLVADDGQ